MTTRPKTRFVFVAVAVGSMMQHRNLGEQIPKAHRSCHICFICVPDHEQGLWDGTRFIFINPPSHEELERRLRGRGTETEEKVQKRLANAMGEIEFSNRVSFFNHKFILDGLAGDKRARPGH